MHVISLMWYFQFYSAVLTMILIWFKSSWSYRPRLTFRTTRGGHRYMQRLVVGMTILSGWFSPSPSSLPPFLPPPLPIPPPPSLPLSPSLLPSLSSFPLLLSLSPSLSPSLLWTVYLSFLHTRFLLDNGAFPAPVNNEGDTPHDLAEDYETIQEMLEDQVKTQGVDVEAMRNLEEVIMLEDANKYELL